MRAGGSGGAAGGRYLNTLTGMTHHKGDRRVYPLSNFMKISKPPNI